MTPSAARPVEPAGGVVDAVVSLPGSKSISNRALLCAGLADGHSRLSNVGWSDDTEAMWRAVSSLLARGPSADAAASVVELTGGGGRLNTRSAAVDARQSGTTARFWLPVLATTEGRHRLDGDEQLRRRPMADGIEALRRLDVEVVEEGGPGHLPVTVVSTAPVRGGRLALRGDVSSQFLSGLLMAAPAFAEGLTVELTTDLVSRPYVDMTVSVMRAFGADVDVDLLAVRPGRYRGADFAIEPDASTASYFFAAAAVTGGRVQVAGLGAHSVQGDVRFVDVLEQMGAKVERDADAITVTGTGTLRGGRFDLGDCSDMAPTLAAAAVYADTTTEVTGVGFIRAKESNRIAAVVRELRRLGLGADETPDGFVVHPGRPGPGVVEPDDDHRIAMSFAVIGLRSGGIAVAEPGCVAKTFPGFWDAFDSLARGARRIGQ